ncbi:MAG: alpha/beta hydrolase [Clostridia bacterium]
MQTLNLNNNRINAEMFLSDNNKVEQIVVAIHGFAGDSKSSVIYALANELTKYNISVIAFDLPCHGEDQTQGRLSLQKCLEYLNEVEKLVKERYFNIPLSYFATSFGAYLLLNHIKNSELKYNKIILKSPAIFMDEVIKNKILKEHNYTLQDLKKQQLNVGFEKDIFIDFNFYNELLVNKLDKFSTKNYFNIIQGKKDNIVDWKQNERFFKRFCKNNYIIKYFETADHRFKEDGELEKIVSITKDILLD